MKIAWLCHYFAPEPGAPQARLLELSRVFLAEGHEVAAVTCFPNHPNGLLRPEDRGRWSRRDELDGIAVHRCRTYVTPNKGFLRKVLGHLSFMISGFLGLKRMAREGRPDVLIVSSPTLFSVITAWWWCLWNRVPFVFEVRDLWPAIFVDLGVLKPGPVLWVLEHLELFLYRQATRVVTVTRTFADHIAARGIPYEKLGVITNGVDAEVFTPGPPDEELLRAEGLEGKSVVLYLGAHGISHGLDRILEVAKRLRDLEDVQVVLVGDGAQKAGLIERVAQGDLPNVTLRGSVPKSEVPRWYRSAEIGLVPLRDVPLFDTFIPSKMFELMAAEVPVVASVRGEAAEILEACGGARVVPPEDVPAIERAIRELHADEGERRRLGQAGRRAVVASYTRTQLGREYLRYLGAAASEGHAHG